MEISVVSHTLLAIFCMAGTYYWGYIDGRASLWDKMTEIASEITDNTLNYLCVKGYIKFSFDEKGEMHLHKVSPVHLKRDGRLKKSKLSSKKY